MSQKRSLVPAALGLTEKQNRDALRFTAAHNKARNRLMELISDPAEIDWWYEQAKKLASAADRDAMPQVRMVEKFFDKILADQRHWDVPHRIAPPVTINFSPKLASKRKPRAINTTAKDVTDDGDEEKKTGTA